MSDDLDARCTQALAAGEVRILLTLLQRGAARPEGAARTPDEGDGARLILLAHASALAGRTQEAAAALAGARRRAATQQQSCAWWRARVELDWSYADARALARDAHVLLAMDASTRSDPDWSRAVHHVGLGLAILREPVVARRCIAALVDGHTTRRCHAAAHELRAELSWQGALDAWVAALIGHKARRGVLALPLDALERARCAYEQFERARDLVAADEAALQRRLRAGADKARLLFAADAAALTRLEHWRRRVDDEPLVREGAMARLALGAAYLAQNYPLRAATVLARSERRGHEARGAELYLAAAAYEASGDHGAALTCLKRRCRDWEAARRPVEDTGRAGDSLASGAAALVERAVIMAIEDPDNSRNVAQLAQALGVSRRTLEYAFRSQKRTSPKRAVTALRLDEASRCLAAQAPARHRSLETVAHRSGFPSYQSFARAVRDAYAVPPSAWRPQR